MTNPSAPRDRHGAPIVQLTRVIGWVRNAQTIPSALGLAGRRRIVCPRRLAATVLAVALLGSVVPARADVVPGVGYSGRGIYYSTDMESVSVHFAPDGMTVDQTREGPFVHSGTVPVVIFALAAGAPVHPVAGQTPTEYGAPVQPVTQVGLRLKRLQPNPPSPTTEAFWHERAEAIRRSDPEADADTDMKGGIVGFMTVINVAFGAKYAPGVECLDPRTLSKNEVFAYLTGDYSTPMQHSSLEAFRIYAARYNTIVLKNNGVESCRLN